MIDVSIIIPTFNSPESCCEAISSCLTSKGLNIEVIVVDDGGALPAAKAITQHFGEFETLSDKLLIQLSSKQSIHYYFQENRGAYKTRLIGIKYASGEFIKFLDHDDVLIEDVLEKEVAQARQEKSDVVMTNWIIRHYDEDSGQTHDEQKYAPDYSGMSCIDGILQKGCPYTSANLYRKNVFNNVSPVTGWKPRLNDDWVLALQACLYEPSYSTLSHNSYIWQHHLTQQSRNTPEGHIDEFYNVLSWLETQLEVSGRLSDKRKRVLANYYFKNAILLCQYQPDRWKEISNHILELNSNFQPKTNGIVIFLTNLLGFEKAVILYVKLKKVLLRSG